MSSYDDHSLAAYAVSVSTGVDVAELTSSLCSSLVHIRLLKSPSSELSSMLPDTTTDIKKSSSSKKQTAEKRWRSIEIDILSRVPQAGMELFLRVNLDHLIASAQKRDRHTSTSSNDKSTSIYQAFTTDGWWQMWKAYDWLSPLSANFMPISSSITFISSNDKKSGSTAVASIPRLTITPSHPLGVGVHDNFAEFSVHRSLRFDDEKGMQEPLVDSSRSHSSLKISYTSSAPVDFRAKRTNKYEATPSSYPPASAMTSASSGQMLVSARNIPMPVLHDR